MVAGVRVRILKPSAGIVDGVALSRLLPGLTYDLAASVGRYLVSCGCADEWLSSAPAVVIPIDDLRALEVITGGIHITQSEAADRPSRRTRKKRR